MNKLFIITLLAWSTTLTSAIIRRDTYLSAYMESHGPSSLPPGEVYAVVTPAGDYGAPANTYGAPANTYGAPATGQGYSYGAPATGYSYEAPAGEPHTLPNPLDPLHAKLVLAFKILLKLLLFKLLVKFIAIICVMFFLPKLSGLGLAKEAGDEARRTHEKDEADRQQMMQFVLDAVSGTPIACREDSQLCRFTRSLQRADSNYSVSKLFKVYMKEEEERLRHKKYLKKATKKVA